MSINYQAFRDNPDAHRRVTEALAVSLVDELSQLNNERTGRDESVRAVPNTQEILAESECGRCSLALWKYFGGRESGLHIVRTDTKVANTTLSHVMLRESEPGERIHDSTWKQFLRLAGVASSRLIETNLPDVAQFSSSDVFEFADEAARLAVRLRENDPGQDKKPDLRGMSREELVRVYADIWDPNAMRTVEYDPGYRISFSAERIAKSMRTLTL